VIIDTSAILAILLGEADATHYEEAIATAWPRRMSAVALLEAAMVVEGRGDAVAGQALDAVLEKASIELVTVTAEHAAAARRAWRRFGKGNHPAALNFGDCFAYALSEITGEPLLFKGSDFSRTDVRVAMPPDWEGDP